MNIAFLYQNHLVEREVIRALRRRRGVKVVTVNTPVHTTEAGAVRVCEAIAPMRCDMLFTINDWGLDPGGYTRSWAAEHGLVHVNWCTDDPFALATMKNLRFEPASNRIDFVSDRAYVPALRTHGYTAHFLPLAADPALFFPDRTPAGDQRRVGFVGNSYRKAQPSVPQREVETLVETYGDFIRESVALLRADSSHDVRVAAARHVDTFSPPGGLSKARAEFVISHRIGALYRVETIKGVAERYVDFRVCGDAGWLEVLPEHQVSTDVWYYTNLNETYRNTRVNLDMNRVVIRDGFTQRVFDCPSSGGFLITSAKPIVEEFFEKDGPSQEIVVFDNETDLHDKIDHYLRNPAERQAIAERGCKKVRAHHTYDHRMDTVFSLLP